MINILEVIKKLEEVYELEFTHNRIFGQWEAMASDKVQITVSSDHYLTNDERNGQMFISVGWETINKKEYAGGGAPLDSIDEAITYLQRFCTKRTELQLSLF